MKHLLLTLLFIASCAQQKYESSSEVELGLIRSYKTQAKHLLLAYDKSHADTIILLADQLIKIAHPLTMTYSRKKPECAPIIQTVLGDLDKLLNMPPVQLANEVSSYKTIQDCNEIVELVLEPVEIVAIARFRDNSNGRQQVQAKTEKVLENLENIKSL